VRDLFPSKPQLFLFLEYKLIIYVFNRRNSAEDNNLHVSQYLVVIMYSYVAPACMLWFISFITCILSRSCVICISSCMPLLPWWKLVDSLTHANSSSTLAHVTTCPEPCLGQHQEGLAFASKKSFLSFVALSHSLLLLHHRRWLEERSTYRLCDMIAVLGEKECWWRFS